MLWVMRRERSQSGHGVRKWADHVGSARACSCPKERRGNYSACTQADLKMLGESLNCGCFDCLMGYLCPGFAREQTKTISNREESLVSHENGTLKWPEKSPK